LTRSIAAYRSHAQSSMHRCKPYQRVDQRSKREEAKSRSDPR